MQFQCQTLASLRVNQGPRPAITPHSTEGLPWLVVQWPMLPAMCKLGVAGTDCRYPGNGTDASVGMLCSSFSCASGALPSKAAEAGIYLHKVSVPGVGKKPKRYAWTGDRNNWEGE